MKRRLFIFAGLALPLHALASNQPWKAEFLTGYFDGNAWVAGLRVVLQPGWKTYWRIPGATGIAPEITAQGDNLKSLQVLYPMPERLRAGDDDVIGYKEEVVFPLRLEPINMGKPMAIDCSAFLGVCDEVCIPVRAQARLALGTASSSSPDVLELGQWVDQVPLPSSGRVTKATVTPDEVGKPLLNLSLAQPVMDIFVEGKPSHYFHAPVISAGNASIKVSGAKSLDELTGSHLRLTVVTAAGGLEETVTVV